MNRNLFVASLLCVLGVSAWAIPTAQTLELSAEDDYRLTAQNPYIQEAAVVGNDDRKEITGRGVGPEQAVVVLEMKVPQGVGGCSGSLIAPNVVLTAAHCLYMDGSYVQAINVFAPGVSQDGSDGQVRNPKGGVKPGIRIPKRRGKGNELPEELQKIIRSVKKEKSPAKYNGDLLQKKVEREVYAATPIEERVMNNVFEDQLQTFGERAQQAGIPSAKAVEWWVPEEWKHAPHHTYDLNKWLDKVERHDYGIVILEEGNELGQKIRPLRIAERADQFLKSMGVTVIGRGGDKPKRTLWKGEGMIKLVRSFYFMHDVDMMKGNSGGPAILAADRNTVVGLNNFHLGSERQREGAVPNGCLRINDKILTVVADAKAGKPLVRSSKTDRPGAKQPGSRKAPKINIKSNPKVTPKLKTRKVAPKSGFEEIIPALKAKFGRQ